MFFEDSNSAYKILEISPNVSDSEVKKLIEKWPKNITLINTIKGSALIKELKKNFKRYKAYETIQRERFMIEFLWFYTKLGLACC